MKLKSLIIVILILLINIMFFNINTVKAAGISDVFSGGDKFVEAGEQGKAKIDEDKLQDASEAIYGILLVIGMVIAVIFSAILGIKFMIGSAEEKAQIKDALIPFVIGCIVIFGAFGIWKIFINIGNNL